MTDKKEKGGCFGLIGALFATLTSHGGCQKLFKNVDDIHIPKAHVQIPANSYVEIPNSSYSKPSKTTLIPAPGLYDEPPQLYDKPILPSDRYNQNQLKPPVSRKFSLDNEPKILPRKDVISLDDLNWSNPDVKSIEAATDNTAREAVKRAKELGLSGEAKREFILEATTKIGYQKKKELSKEKIFIPNITVDIIIATSVNQALEEENNS